MGVRVWAMVEFEADDGLASAAERRRLWDERVGKVFICTPDKDLSECVVGTRVVQMDRRKNEVRDEVGVVEKFGVRPESIPDYLGVVGDSADGFPGVKGWGAKGAAMVLSRYWHLEGIPKDWREWDRRFAAGASWRKRCSRLGRMRCCFGGWLLCGLMCRCLRRWRSCGGRGRGRGLREFAGG